MNDRAALDLLATHGPLSRSRLGGLTGLSKPTVSQLLARLEAAGLVIGTGTSGGGPGPNARLYALNPDAARVAALDVTAGTIRAAIADITGRTIGRHQVSVPARRSVRTTAPAGTRAGGTRAAGQPVTELLTAALEGAAAEAGVALHELHHAVIGTPGAFDPSTGRLRYAQHLPGWHSPDLLEELATTLPMPFSCDNDVNLVAVAEHQLGVANDVDDFLLLWNEAGMGAALVIGGTLYRGWTGGAGEVGFLPVPGAPLVRDAARAGSGGYQELAGAGAVLRLADELGVPRPPYARKMAVEHAAAGLLSEAARGTGQVGDAGERLLQRFATALATGLAGLLAMLDPPVVVLSGGLLAAGGEPLRERVRAELAELAVPRPRLVLGTVTERPVLTGALRSALASTRQEVFDTSR
ncbi:ROK family transcriptional regulator [Streptomyces oceani]|uniref:ROK family transcriptional regulator n=1 Tax=Streptomyces oceani TaxID=1075402 RepID=A0A1E7KG63_9ACTN|nr:ROK family transcriptional regulator [Streptomyces oceani]OEV02920.1 ROK family transcriptional regulator [Streptomyces oceani]